MNEELILNLEFSCTEKATRMLLPLPLRDSYKLIYNFFENNTNNKLCLIFPSKEYVAQWISVPIVLSLIKADYELFKEEITQSYKEFKAGEKLILNSQVVVEWVGLKEFEIQEKKINELTFKTKHNGLRTIKDTDLVMLQKAPLKKQVLSSMKRAEIALKSIKLSPLEDLLKIRTYGNKKFIKESLCLISKFKSYEMCQKELFLFERKMSEYFTYSKIDEEGRIDETNPFLISSKMLNFTFSLEKRAKISKIIIDGYGILKEYHQDFIDSDNKYKIPTILITDLSEIEEFSNIKNLGFDVYNFTKENIKSEINIRQSPFELFNLKLKNYLSFKLNNEILYNSQIETIAKNLHAVSDDYSNENLSKLKYSLIGLLNTLSRICHAPNKFEIDSYEQRLTTIKIHFSKSRMLLGGCNSMFEKAISELEVFIEKLHNEKTQKCIKLEELILQEKYAYIVCPTTEEVNSLEKYLLEKKSTNLPKIISVLNLNEKFLTLKSSKAILTGWPKTNNLNQIYSSFLFSEVIGLFYQFENSYFNSWKIRNSKSCESIKTSVTNTGITIDESSTSNFAQVYEKNEINGKEVESTFDISDFEFTLDNAQYSKYLAKGVHAESAKARRINFENNTFIYSTESHKLLIVNDLINSDKACADIDLKKIETLLIGDVIAFINTERDILVELVEKKVNNRELEEVKKWVNLWKQLLHNYYNSIGREFQKLVSDLRRCDCKKHQVTIRSWLYDENKIGPQDNEDIESIAVLTGSELLMDNVLIVRDSIRKMTGWRMQASDLIRSKIKDKMLEIADLSVINKTIDILELGKVEILKICELKQDFEAVDIKFVNRLLQKDLF